jgi:hypothetical protein
MREIFDLAIAHPSTEFKPLIKLLWIRGFYFVQSLSSHSQRAGDILGDHPALALLDIEARPDL